MKNDAVNKVDYLGLTIPGMSGEAYPPYVVPRCRLSVIYDFEDPDDAWTLGKRIYVKSITDVESHLKELFRDKKYSPDGDCCKGSCIDSISLTSHGIGKGVIPLSRGPDVMESFDPEYDPALLEPGKPSGQNQANYLRGKQLLLQLKSKMCQGGKIHFATCNSGTPALQTALQTIFGPEISVITYSGLCVPTRPGFAPLTLPAWWPF